MSNVVQFLEALGRDPKPLTPDQFSAAIARTDMDPSAQKALLERNADALNKALGGRLKMMCMVVPAENEEPQEGEGDGDGDGEGGGDSSEPKAS